LQNLCKPIRTTRKQAKVTRTVTHSQETYHQKMKPLSQGK
jgi:hypothetical protein